MDFLQELRAAFEKETISGIMSENILARLGKWSSLANSQNLVNYILQVAKFRTGNVTGDEIAKEMEKLVEAGYTIDFLTQINREITAATVRPEEARFKGTYRRYLKTKPRHYRN